ncbi:MAG TPA: glycosyltransferase 87 family protein [Myxococcota bacterium]
MVAANDEGRAAGSFWARLVAWAGSLSVPTLQALVLLGIVIRVVVWVVSDGSNDIRSWNHFANQIHSAGVLHEYVVAKRFNHPPLMGLWASAAERIALLGHMTFAHVFKVLPLMSDMVAVFVLHRAVRRRGGSEAQAWRVAAVFALSVPSIWITAHHGNTDSACALLAFSALLLVDDGERPFWAGLVFAAALNVKLLPLVLAPALLVLQATSWRKLAWFALGGAIGCLPFLAPLLAERDAFIKNAIDYSPHPSRWGIHLIFDSIAGQIDDKVWRAPVRAADGHWRHIARYVLMLASLAIGIWARMRKHRPLDVGALVLAMFLVLTPGLGVQYLVYPVLPLTAVDVRRGFLYSLFAGGFTTCIYLHYMQWRFPFRSVHTGQMPISAAVLGFVAWIILCEFLWSRLRGR